MGNGRVIDQVVPLGVLSQDSSAQDVFLLPGLVPVEDNQVFKGPFDPLPIVPVGLGQVHLEFRPHFSLRCFLEAQKLNAAQKAVPREGGLPGVGQEVAYLLVHHFLPFFVGGAATVVERGDPRRIYCGHKKE